MKNKFLPNIFIIGTMKGGTTVLHDYLCTHPNVCAGKNKEIHYFSLHRDRGVDWYVNQFSNVTENKKSVDASPTYFDVANDDSVPCMIKKLVPDAKLILIIRDPISRAVSHFHHLQKINKIQSLTGLTAEEYFNKNLLNNNGKSKDRHFQQIINFSMYLNHYLNYRKHFNKDNILVIKNAELRKEPIRTMQRVFSHINLPMHNDKMYGEFRYSTGSSVNELSCETYNKLACLLYPDFTKFCREANICFSTDSRTDDGDIKVGNKKNDDLNLNDVNIGSNGWLFLTGGSNSVINYYIKPDIFTDEIAKKWLKLLSSRKNKLEFEGIKYIHLIAPEKISVYPEFFHGKLPYFSKHPIATLFHNITNNDDMMYIINPIPYFNKIKKNVNIYWKTDTHWTFWGCFAAYQLICSAIGCAPNNDLQKRPFTEGKICFDLGGKLSPTIRENGRFYQLLHDSERVHANALVLHQEKEKIFNDANLHVGTNVAFKNKNKKAHQSCVVIFGDSFSEYRPHLLTGMLAETFSEVHFVWSSEIDYGYIKRVGADIVITEIAERFMARLPTDELNIEKFSRQRLKKFLSYETLRR